MGNNVEQQHLGNAPSSTTLLHQMRDLWKSPRGTVLRIETLALVAIAFSFLVAAFGSCRRWSNRWIVQKGFLAANVLSVSLGTYSIGLMQSSSVKSEMYPIWAVSLFALLPCIDPVTSYVGHDYKSPLSKMVFQISLYFGYVLLMSISTTSIDNGNKAICILCAITFLKGFHRSLAFVLPVGLRNRIESLEDGYERWYLVTKRPKGGTTGTVKADISPDLDPSHREVSMDDIHTWFEAGDSQEKKREKERGNDVLSFQNVSLALSLSHLLQRHFVGLSRTDNWDGPIVTCNETIDYKRALELVEVELAFLYDTFFTSNAFLHYYQAKAASLWTFASFIGICFVGVTVAIPGTMTRRSATTPDPGAGTSIVVDTTTADRIITLIIIFSMSLLQLVLLIRCWTSNWARVAVACQYVRNQVKGDSRPIWWMRRPKWWMRLKESIVTMNINWTDRYLWQDMLGQHSIVEGSSKGEWKLFSIKLPIGVTRVYGICASLLRVFGFQYIGQVLVELWGRKTKVGGVRLHADVKASFVEFLGQIKSDRIGQEWVSIFIANGISSEYLLYKPGMSPDSDDATRCLLVWHIATCYCELAEREQVDSSTGCTGNTVACFKKAAGCFHKQKADVTGEGEAEKYRRVAIALSKYYAYLAKSAPELLPGRTGKQKQLYGRFAWEVKKTDRSARATSWEEMRRELYDKQLMNLRDGFDLGAQLGEEPGLQGTRRCDHWKVLARFWVQAFVYVAPYGNLESHREHLSQGGEFITHLWALLYHLGIYEWKPISRLEFSEICDDIEDSEDSSEIYENSEEEIERESLPSDIVGRAMENGGANDGQRGGGTGRGNGQGSIIGLGGFQADAGQTFHLGSGGHDYGGRGRGRGRHGGGRLNGRRNHVRGGRRGRGYGNGGNGGGQWQDGDASGANTGQQGPSEA